MTMGLFYSFPNQLCEGLRNQLYTVVVSRRCLLKMLLKQKLPLQATGCCLECLGWSHAQVMMPVCPPYVRGLLFTPCSDR